MSQQDGAKKKIGDRMFTMYPLPPMKSHELLMDLFQMFGPALGTALDGFMGGSDGLKKLAELGEQDLGPDFFSSASKQLFNGYKKETSREIIEALREVTLVDPGGKLDEVFDIVFLDKLEQMYAWLFWGLKVQWGKSPHVRVRPMLQFIDQFADLLVEPHGGCLEALSDDLEEAVSQISRKSGHNGMDDLFDHGLIPFAKIIVQLADLLDLSSESRQFFPCLGAWSVFLRSGRLLKNLPELLG